jgi:hypothetical protein
MEQAHEETEKVNLSVLLEYLHLLRQAEIFRRQHPELNKFLPDLIGSNRLYLLCDLNWDLTDEGNAIEG